MTTQHDLSTFTRQYFLTAGMCSAKALLPLPLLVAQFIDVASLHANALGIGYKTLIDHGIGWVLSRLTIDMVEWPGINACYQITTWIEDVNRHLSERCAIITDAADGRVLGHLRSTWAALDYQRRCAADLSVLPTEAFVHGNRECPVVAPRRLRQLTGEDIRSSEYTFQYCDTDFNGHVNSTRYIELLLNKLGSPFVIAHKLQRFEICYHHEAYAGQRAQVDLGYLPNLVEAIITIDGNVSITSRLHYANEND